MDTIQNSGKVLISGNTYSDNNTGEDIGILKTEKDLITIEDENADVKEW